MFLMLLLLLLPVIAIAAIITVCKKRTCFNFACNFVSRKQIERLTKGSFFNTYQNLTGRVS